MIGTIISAGHGCNCNGCSHKNLLGLGVKNIATPILNAQFGGPQPGQFISRNANGSYTAYALPSGGSSLSLNPFGGAGSSISGTTWLIIAAAGIGLLMLSKK